LVVKPTGVASGKAPAQAAAMHPRAFKEWPRSTKELCQTVVMFAPLSCEGCARSRNPADLLV